MNSSKLIAYLRVLIQQFNIEIGKSVKLNNVYPNTNVISDKLIINHHFELEVLNTKFKKLLDRRNDELVSIQEDTFKYIVYKVIKFIFLNTNQDERFSYFDEVIETAYDIIIQKCIDLKQSDRIILRKEYKIMTRNFIPIIKIDILLDDLDNKEIFDELLEYFEHPEVIREDTYPIIKKILHNQQCKYHGYEFIPITPKLGFLGEYAKLKIFVEYQGKDAIFNLFIKFVPKNHDEYFQEVATNSFIKEELFYNTYLDMLKQVGVEEQFAPICYLVSENFIVLEDLSVNGFSAVSRLTILDYPHLSKALKEIAKMHACSILLEEKLSSHFKFSVKIDKYFPDMIKESQYLKNKFNLCHIDHCIMLLSKFAEVFKNHDLADFQQIAREKLLNIFNIVKKSNKYKNVINHGDVWWSNIFYTWDVRKNPTQCRLLDFQLIRYVPPCCDIIMFLYITTNRQTRREKLNDLMEDYYNEMKSILDKYDLDIRNILPFTELLKSFEELKIWGIFLATLYHSVNALPTNIIAKIFSDPEKGTKFWSDSDYRCKVFEAAWDHIQHKEMLKENALNLYDICFN